MRGRPTPLLSSIRATGARLFRLLRLPIGAAVATITLKVLAWSLTGSVGLLSDAAESVVNLVAAIVALLALRWAAKPADEGHVDEAWGIEDPAHASSRHPPKPTIAAAANRARRRGAAEALF